MLSDLYPEHVQATLKQWLTDLDNPAKPTTALLIVGNIQAGKSTLASGLASHIKIPVVAVPPKFRADSLVKSLLADNGGIVCEADQGIRSSLASDFLIDALSGVGFNRHLAGDRQNHWIKIKKARVIITLWPGSYMFADLRHRCTLLELADSRSESRRTQTDVASSLPAFFTSLVGEIPPHPVAARNTFTVSSEEGGPSCPI